MLAMYFVHPASVLGPKGALMLGIALLGLGNVFFEFASVNYNAMLNHLGEKEDRGKISGFGWAAGYIGGIVLGYTWQVMLNALLQRWGQTIVNDWRLGLAGLVMLVNWQLMGYMMVIYIAGLQNVPPELIEASQIDGASRWQTLRNVTLPMIMPSITICLFLTLANTFKMYDQNLALTNGAPAKQTQMAALSIVNTMYKKIGQEGVAQAEAVIFFLIVAAIALIQLSATRSKEVDA